ncbi:hypothetical protein D3C72_1590160 [compost metagenome]
MAAAFSHSRTLLGRKETVPEVPEVWLIRSSGTAWSIAANQSSSPWQPLTSAAAMRSALSGVTSLPSHLLIWPKLFFSSREGG